MSKQLKAIREKCLDCCGRQPSKVRECTLTSCTLYPYRMGTNPYTNRKGNPSIKNVNPHKRMIPS